MTNPPIKYHLWLRSRHLLKTLSELGCDFPILEAVFNVSYAPRPIDLGSPTLVDSVPGGRCMPVWLMLSDPKEWRTSWENPWKSSMNEVLIELMSRVVGLGGDYQVETGPLKLMHRLTMSSLLDDVESVWLYRTPAYE